MALRSGKAVPNAITSELDAIADGQKFHDVLITRINTVRSKYGLPPDQVPLEAARDFMGVCVEAMRWAVSYKEIDAAARELYGDRFDGISICEAHKKATELAHRRKNEEVFRLTGQSNSE